MMFKRILLSILALAAGMAAMAESLVLPPGTKEILACAFEGCDGVTEVVLPEGLRDVGDAAFRDCRALNRVVLPSTLTKMGEGCFSGCAEALYLICPPDCAATEWARGSGFDYTAQSSCRALVIGQSYAGTDHQLNGPVNDARAMAFCLRRMETRSYAVTQRTNLTAEGILEAIADVFADSGQDDLSLLFYAGHGAEDGSLYGSDLKLLSPSRLRSALDAVPGRKVVIVDACYSGALLEDSADALLAASSRDRDSGPERFAQAFTAAFGPRKRSAFGGADRYYVLTSAHAGETSEEAPIQSGGNSRVMGYFTYALCRGCGWDGVAFSQTDMAADVNADDAVTLREAFRYADALARQYNEGQSAMAYPEDCTAFAPFRK